MEIWKDIKNYEDCYEVSSHGRVRRKEGYVNTGIKHNEKKLVKSKILKCNLKRNGYLTVDLSKNNQVKTISVHRIVALTFIENDDPSNKKEVNHKNCNKLDNRVENLEWVTRKQNKDHALENNRYRCDHKKKIRCKQLNMTFESSYEAAEYLNIHYFQNSKQVKNISAKIRAATCGIQKSAYGFTWEYCI
jgi:hypothetical protein